MSEYQLELKQIVDYPRCRIYRQFIGLLMKDKSIRVGGTSGLYHFTVLSCFANFRTSYKRIDGISYTIYPGEWLCRVSELTEWFRTRFQHQALAILRELQDRHLITYTLLGRGRLVKFKIKGWCKYNRVLEYNAPCQKDEKETNPLSLLRCQSIASPCFRSLRHGNKGAGQLPVCMRPLSPLRFLCRRP